MPILTCLFSLNPDVDKLNYLTQRNFEIEYLYTEQRDFDLINTYRYTGISIHEKSDMLRRMVLEYFNSADDSLRISSNVLFQCFAVIDSLYPSILEYSEILDIYSTTNGTIVFDWEKDIDNVFSLEIGANEIGYFIEVNGTDEKQVDSLVFEDSKKELIQDLSRFLFV